MKKNTVIGKLQTIFGVTKGELILSFVILSGLIIGLGYRILLSDNSTNRNSQTEELYHALDSLAKVQRSTFTGSDVAGNPEPELALGDTIVPKENYFPKNQKKELPAGKININTASITELMKLPGVGESTAKKIIEYRSKTPFKKPEDIMNIKGIGEKKFEKMKPFIMV